MSHQLDLPFLAPDLVARLHAAGFPASLPVTLHTNARTMVSLGRDGGLRVHRGYARAPDRVIRAIVTWARARRRAHRREAGRMLLAFPADRYAASPSRPRRRRPTAAPEQESWIGCLRGLHDDLNARHFGGALGPVDLTLSTRMRRRLGHFEPGAIPGEPNRIVISRRHIMRDGWTAAGTTLLHEMVHQWQHENALPLDHGPVFRRKAREVGIEPSAVWRRVD